jgi:hypothetical protein
MWRGDRKLIGLLGKMFEIYVATSRAWCQKEGGREAWTNKVRIMLLIDRIFRSALPF